MKTSFVLLVSMLFFSFAYGAERSPFTDVLYDSPPSVKIELNETVYYLLSIQGVSREDIMTVCQQVYADDCQRRFALQFVETLSQAGIAVGESIQLRLYHMPTHEVSVVEAPVTSANRESIEMNWELRGDL